MHNRRFGRKIALPSTISIKRQILTRMLVEAIGREQFEAAAAETNEKPADD